jgi:DNA-binding MarR family transcriptional regulator
MTELTSRQLVEVILHGLAEARADIRERERLLKSLELSPVTERALAGLSAEEVAQVIRDLSRAAAR